MQKKIRLKQYECTILFVISSNFVKDATKYDKQHKIVPDEDHHPEDEGYTISSEKNYVTIINDKHLTHNTIAHEMYHLTCNIGDDTGITDEESRAWICGYVTEELYKLKDRWTLKKDTAQYPASKSIQPTTPVISQSPDASIP